MTKPWQPPSTAPPQPAHDSINLNALIEMHRYLNSIPTRSPIMEATLTHLETQLSNAITGIIVTKGPTQ